MTLSSPGIGRPDRPRRDRDPEGPARFDFLADIYSVPGIKERLRRGGAASIRGQRRQGPHRDPAVRGVMASNGTRQRRCGSPSSAGDRRPLTAPASTSGRTARRSCSPRSFKLILGSPERWNLQRLYWFDWRDPRAGLRSSRTCASAAGAPACWPTTELRSRPSDAFRAFTADAVPPPRRASAGGPSRERHQRSDSQLLLRLKRGGLDVRLPDRRRARSSACVFAVHGAQVRSNGPHTFSVRAIDAAGNESALVSRSFTVTPADSRAPPALTRGGRRVPPLILATATAAPAGSLPALSTRGPEPAGTSRPLERGGEAPSRNAELGPRAARPDHQARRPEPRTACAARSCIRGRRRQSLAGPDAAGEHLRG